MKNSMVNWQNIAVFLCVNQSFMDYDCIYNKAYSYINMQRKTFYKIMYKNMKQISVQSATKITK